MLFCMKESRAMRLKKKTSVNRIKYICLLLWIGTLCFVLCACKEEQQKVDITPSLQPSPTDEAGEVISSVPATPTPDIVIEPTSVPGKTPTPVVTAGPTPTVEPVVTMVPTDIPLPTVSPTDIPLPSPTEVPKEPPEPYFDNPLVEAAVRTCVGNPDRVLIPEDFISITVLDLSECELTDVSFLSEFINLQELDLSWNNLSDCTSLPELKHLTKLILSYNFINEIQVLSSYTELTELSLRANNLTRLSVSVISSETEDLQETEVSEIYSVFDGLSKLTHLDLSYNMLSEVSELSGLTALEYLNLEKNRITDFSAVEFVPELLR